MAGRKKKAKKAKLKTFGAYVLVNGDNEACLSYAHYYRRFLVGMANGMKSEGYRIAKVRIEEI